MAVKLVGTMKVRSINGRYGQFAVGELITDIGTFKVKDTTLDQYAEGEYRGEFIITRIFPNSYVMHSRVVTEVCATVSEIFLETAEEKVALGEIEWVKPLRRGRFPGQILGKRP
jgi:hypothetical protein